MKKTVSILSALLMTVSAIAACSPQTPPDTTPATVTEDGTAAAPADSTGAVTEAPETDEIIKAPDEDEGLSAWYVHSFVKTDPERPADTGLRSYTVYMTRGEVEDAQIVISSGEAKEGLSVRCDGLKNKNGDVISAEIFRQYYIKCGKKYYPDPVAPMNETTERFDIAPGKSQASFISLRTDKTTPPGDYEGVVSVEQDGKTVKQLRLFARVWDIVMPETMTGVATVNLYADQIERFHGKNMYKEYFDFLLDYHVNPWDLPYDILDRRADAYMSDPRINSFSMPYEPTDNVKLSQRYQKVSENAEWLKKSFFYPFDEPTNVDMINNLAGRCIRIKEYCPGARIVSPFFTDIAYDAERDQIAVMSEYINIWCPKVFCFTKVEERKTGRRMLYNAEQRKTQVEFNERMKQMTDRGDDLWWYVCWEPGKPYLNMFVDMTGMQNKLLFWQQKQYNVNGFLYWSSNCWERVEDPWTNMATVGTDYRTGQSWLSDSVYGDGSLLYPGSKVNVDGACGSFRLHLIRDGIEEFEMLTMLEKLAGRDAVDAIIGQVSTNVVEYSSDDDAFALARIRLGDELEAALKK